MKSSTEISHRIVVVGGGVAGLQIATQLARRRRPGSARYELTLVDRGTAHVWKPMLHMIAAGTREVALQQTAYLAQARAAGFEYAFGALGGLNRRSKQIQVLPHRSPEGQELTPERWLSYDTLIVAIGSRANDFGTPGATDFCSRIDSNQQAEAFFHQLREQALVALSKGGALQVGIVGGGATGVELAAELLQFASSAVAFGVKEFKDRLQVTLLESGPRLLAAFPEDIAEATRVRLESLGVQVRLGARVRAVDAGGFALADGSRVEAQLRVWAAGVQAQALANGWDGLETSRAGQLVVRPSLQTTVDPDIIAVGDCASLALEDGKPLPPTAQVAHQQALHVVRHLPALLRWEETMPAFRHRDLGALVSLGDYGAYASLGRTGLFKGVTLRGRLAQLAHVMLYRSHQARLHGFWRGSLLWLIDRLHARLAGPIRMG